MALPSTKDTGSSFALRPSPSPFRRGGDIIPAKAPGEQVVELAKLTHADLIAIGVPHGRSLADALRGSTAERIVQQSGCPVLAVNAFAAAAERRAIVQEEKTAQIW